MPDRTTDAPHPASEPARRIVDALPADAPRTILIDGFSGAGKSTLADLVVAEWASRGDIRPYLLRLEWVYPGWDGLHAASDMLVRDVLMPISAGTSGSWRRWDWTTDAPGLGDTVPPDVPLVVEGVGALSRRARRLVGLGVWVQLDVVSRRRRALARDGDTYRPHWERWAAQERAYAAGEDPRAIADLEIDGSQVVTRGTGPRGLGTLLP